MTLFGRLVTSSVYAEDALDREHPPALPEGFTVDVQFKRGKSMFSDEYRNDRIKDHFLVRAPSAPCS